MSTPCREEPARSEPPPSAGASGEGATSPLVVIRRAAVLIGAALAVLGGVLMLATSGGWAADEARVRSDAGAALERAADRLAATFAPARQVAEAAARLDPARDLSSLERLLADAAAASEALRGIALHDRDGRALVASSSDRTVERPDLARFASLPGGSLAFVVPGTVAEAVELRALVRRAGSDETFVVVADLALARPARDGEREPSWRLQLPGGQELPPPAGFAPPSVAPARHHWLLSPVGRAFAWLSPRPTALLAPIPGTDATVAVGFGREFAGSAHAGAILVGFALLVGGFVAGGLLAPGLARRAIDREAERRAESRIRNSLAAIAQDARTPIGNIHGFATLLTETELHPEQAGWAGRIQAAAQSLGIVMEGLMDIGEPPGAGIEPDISAARPDLLVREVIGLFEGAVLDRGLELRARLDDSLPEYFDLDERKVRRILFHLLDNAVKYTSTGEVVVRGRREEDGEGGGRLVLEIEDSGPGVPPEEREMIFERFRRGRGRDIAPDGLGLGLFVARRLARALGGDVGLRDREGGGSVFSLTLPARQARMSPTSLALRGRTALLVGFEPLTRARIAATLHRLGLVAETAPDGFLGLGTAERMAFTHGDLDVILLDDGLVGMPPEAFLRRLRSVSTFAELPVILTLRRGRESLTDPAPFHAVVADDAPAPQLETTLTRVLGLEPEAGPGKRGRLGRVLVVEDNHANRLLLVEVLKRAGYTPFVATDAYAALNMLVRVVVDLVVTDVALPGMDGIELAERLKARPATRAIPIIAVSAHDDAETAARLREAGVASLLPKPLDPKRFLRLMADTLRQARMTLPEEEAAPAADEERDRVLVAAEYLEAMFLDIGPARTRRALGDLIDAASRDLPRLSELLGSGIAPTETGFIDGLREMAAGLGAVQLETELEAVSAALAAGDVPLAASHSAGAERVWGPSRIALLRSLIRCERKYGREASEP